MIGSFDNSSVLQGVSLRELGRDINQTLQNLNISFENTDWDLYEQRSRQLAVSRKILGADVAGGGFGQDFMRGFQTIDSLLENRSFTDRNRNEIVAIKPRRKRAVADFHLRKSAAAPQTWTIDRLMNRPFKQAQSRFFPGERKFTAMSEWATATSEFRELLQLIARRVAQTDSSIEQLAMTCHQVTLLAEPGDTGDGSPEGIHQDGADFIVPALVVLRENTVGGVSRLYQRVDGMFTILSEETLMPGYGWLHPDRGTNFWHDVSPIASADGTHACLRRSIGFDVNIVKT